MFWLQTWTELKSLVRIPTVTEEMKAQGACLYGKPHKDINALWGKKKSSTSAGLHKTRGIRRKIDDCT